MAGDGVNEHQWDPRTSICRVGWLFYILTELFSDYFISHLERCFKISNYNCRFAVFPFITVSSTSYILRLYHSVHINVELHLTFELTLYLMPCSSISPVDFSKWRLLILALIELCQFPVVCGCTIAIYLFQTFTFNIFLDLYLRDVSHKHYTSLVLFFFFFNQVCQSVPFNWRW